MIDLEKEETAAKLKGSLTEFIKFFLKYITQRDYIQSQPIGRESHQITLCREFTSLLRMQHPEQNLLINVEPGSGKTLHLCMFVAWAMASYPDANFIYISFSHTLSASNTAFIKQIMSSELYAYLFDVHISKESRAKDHFATTAGGHVAAFGSAGAITGRNAGLPGLNRFSGAVIVDDAHKPDEAHSDTIRQKVISNYEETIRQRPRGSNVPIIYVGQRVHEDDLAAFLLSGKDTKPWRAVILKALDDAGNALYPEVHDKKFLQELEKKSPYVFASQFQQDPLPSGGGIFKPEWFVALEQYPDIQATFITADTAETAKTYNDATVFSFWGVYEIESFGRNTGLVGLHWIDCVEMRIEPKDLKDAFLDFWQECNRFKCPPRVAAIEKKSTGVTLVSALSEIRGIQIRNIERSRASGSKTERFLRAQPYVANKQISINESAKHKKLVIDHLSKITANDSHRHDDIADTLADAIDIALIEKQIKIVNNEVNAQEQEKNDKLRSAMLKRINARSATNGRYR